MKKRIYLLYLCILVVVLYSSCKRLIEIPANPPTKISQGQQFSDSSTAMGAIAAIYDYTPPSFFFGDFSSLPSGFGYDNALFSLATGLSSDELSTTNITDPSLGQFYSYGLSQTSTDIEGLWSAAYTNIYIINAILEGVQNNAALSSIFSKQVTGEMKVVRSLYYFNLINLFGGVPLVTATDYRQSVHIPRTSVDSVYNQIIGDLNEAVSDLNENYPSEGKARPNIYTAMALLAKVNLYKENWQSAYNESDSIINSGMYSLEPDLSNVFLDGSNEAIWQLPLLGPVYATSEAAIFTPSSDGIAPTYLITPSLLNTFEQGDLRLNWIQKVDVSISETDSQSFYYPAKYKNVLFSDNDPTEDYMIFRLGEIILIHAEAAVHLGKLDQALTDINSIRTRAGLSNSTASGQTEILKAIMHERQTELFCEWGNRWFDLKRTNTAGTVLSAEKSGWSANAMLYPVPRNEILLDNLLAQNPGY